MTFIEFYAAARPLPSALLIELWCSSTSAEDANLYRTVTPRWQHDNADSRQSSQLITSRLPSLHRHLPPIPPIPRSSQTVSKHAHVARLCEKNHVQELPPSRPTRRPLRSEHYPSSLLREWRSGPAASDEYPNHATNISTLILLSQTSTIPVYRSGLSVEAGGAREEAKPRSFGSIINAITQLNSIRVVSSDPLYLAESVKFH